MKVKKEVKSPKTIKEFYNLMKKIRNLKGKITLLILKNKKVNKKHIRQLREFLNKLENIKKEESKYILYTGKEKIKLGLDYEISELKKDLIYLEKGEKRFLDYLSKKYPLLNKEKKNIINKLKRKKLDIFITDRDGTINNYCERYLSSVQSIYNAVFLTNFINKYVKSSIILTSAPLKYFLRVNVMPKQSVIFSGSKGREFITKSGKKKVISLSKEQKKVFKKLTKEIRKFLSQSKHRKFIFIGSGFQEKHGELTIARQNISNSINKKDSEKFLKKIKETVKKIDPSKKFFTINDTGLDIEITLKQNKTKNFGKGIGIKYILKNSKIKMTDSLVCGDSKSDVSLLKTTEKLSKKTYTIFVTKDNNLKKEVKTIVPDAMFVSAPDTLITTLYEISK